MSAHRYWRISILSNGGSTETTIAQIHFNDAAGNRMSITGGTAIASDYVSGQPPSLAFDDAVATDGTNTYTTYWQPSEGFPSWIGYDFGSPVAVQTIDMYGTSNYGRFPASAPVNITVDYSDDGAAWTVSKASTLSWDFPSNPASFNAVPTYSISLITEVNGSLSSYRNVRALTQSGIYGVNVQSDYSASATIPLPDGHPVYLIAFDDYAQAAWQPNLAFNGNSFTYPTSPTNTHYYQAGGDGTTGSSEPTWPTNGGSVTDGTITWTDQGLIRPPVIVGPCIPDLS